MNTFDVVWETLAESGGCDAIGGAEYQRLRKEWQVSGKRLACLRWIMLNANEMPPLVRQTTSQDAPGSANADPCG